MSGKLGVKMLRALLGASEVLHAHDHGAFHERLFRAVNILYRDTYHAFEVYGLNNGSHSIESDMPFPEKRRSELLQRTGEVVPVDHPIFPLLLNGDTTPRRLSDLISRRKLLKTDLYNDIFSTVDVEFQIAIPFSSPEFGGGLSINRGETDYTDEDLAAAHIFARHIHIAYQTEQILHGSAPLQQAMRRADFTCLRRRGLTRRECEVLWWVSQGKRDAEIAVILGISPRTASGHVRSILAKLRVENRTSAVNEACRAERPLEPRGQSAQ
jgi:DNA-binding CsgD family transcriptional regulator